MTMRKEKAAGRAATAARTTIHQQAYDSHRPMSRPYSQKLPPGRRDRRPAQSPAPRPARSPDAATVGLLLLLLSIGGETLTPSRARAAWEIAENWAGQYIEAKHQQEAA